MAAGFAVLSGREWARWTGFGIAALSVIGQMPFAQAYPLWTLLIIAVDFMVVYGLTVSGGRAAGSATSTREEWERHLRDVSSREERAAWRLVHIGTLEKNLGVPVPTLAGHQVDPAAIDDAQIARIKELESRLVVSLVAVKG